MRWDSYLGLCRKIEDEKKNLCILVNRLDVYFWCPKQKRKPHFLSICLLFLSWIILFIFGHLLRIIFLNIEWNRERKKWCCCCCFLVIHRQRIREACNFYSLLFQRMEEKKTTKILHKKDVWVFGVCLLLFFYFFLIVNFVNSFDKIFEIIFHHINLWHWSIYCQFFFLRSSCFFGVIGFFWFDQIMLHNGQYF